MRKFAITIFVIFMSINFIFAENIKLMTYNIRYAAPEDYNNSVGWNDRKFRLVQFFRYHQPDIICMQEVLREQLEYLNDKLTQYKSFGIARDDGKTLGEYTPIFWDTTKFQVIDGGNFWLSKTPEKPSKDWDAALNRIATYVLLKQINSGEEFYIFNTHFDHVGVVARKNSAELILKKINSICKGKPAILAGDLNTEPNTEPYLILANNFSDSFIVSESEPYGPVGTSSGFNVCADKKLNRIDFIFTNDKIKVYNYSTLTDSYNKHYLSDHLPIIIELNILK